MFDSFTIYCLATGKPIAQINDDETGVIIDSLAHIPLADQATHLERLALSSMRPSLVWMSVTPALIEHMRESNPRQLLAYLLNRLYTHTDVDRHTGKPLNHDSWLAARRQRVLTWDRIESSGISDTVVNSMLYVLLRIDSRYNLAKIAPTISIRESWDTWHSDIAGFTQALWDWNSRLEAKELEDYKRAKFQAEFWSEGSRLTRAALAKQFEKVTPPSPRKVEQRVKTAKLAHDLGFLDQLEREFAGRTAKASETTVTAQRVTPAPKQKIVRFGVKKDS